MCIYMYIHIHCRSLKKRPQSKCGVFESLGSIPSTTKKKKNKYENLPYYTSIVFST